MGQVYTLPVLSYPNLVPIGTTVNTSTNYDDCLYGLNNSLLICGNGIDNGVGSGSNVANTISAWYINTEGSSDRYYYIAINKNSSWIHSTVSISDINSSSYRSSAWGFTVNANEPLYGSNDNLGYPMIVNPYSSLIEAEQALGIYPITYHLTNCTAPSAPIKAASGTEVVVNITPSQGYILRSSGVSVIDSNGISVPHIVQGNQIAFTMPYET